MAIVINARGSAESEQYEPLCLMAVQANSTIILWKRGNPSWAGSYSLDGTTWTTYTPSSTGTITLTNIGDKVWFKGTYTAANNYDNYLYFEMGGKIQAYGNVMSMCDADNFGAMAAIPYAYMFTRLFVSCTALTKPPLLPATVLTDRCYSLMFQSSGIVEGPVLPSTNLAYSCYYGMFMNCRSLLYPSALPATQLVLECYDNMFSECKALKIAPELPATTLVESCYSAMFSDCTSLIDPPELPATVLAEYCYISMFNGCTALKTVPKLLATTLYNYCYNYMFYGCTSLYVSDSSGSGYSQAWYIPQSGNASGNYTMSNMFTNCLGSRSTNSPNFNGTRKTYYTQNQPI